MASINEEFIRLRDLINCMVQLLGYVIWQRAQTTLTSCNCDYRSEWGSGNPSQKP